MANLKQVVYLTQADYAALLNDTHDPKQYTKNGKTIYFDPNTLYITESTVSMSELEGILPVGKGGTGVSTLASGYALIGNGTSPVTTRGIRNNTSTGALGWTSSTVDNTLVTTNTLAYWNGAYTGTTSNISKLGTITNGTWQATVIGAAYGGTGQNTLNKSANALINALDTGSSDLTANDYVITQYVGGGTTTTTYHRRPANKVINATLVKAALETNATHGNAYLRKDGTWQVPPYPVTSVAGKTGAVTLAKGDVGLGNVDNTADANKTVLALTDFKVSKYTIPGSKGVRITYPSYSPVLISCQRSNSSGRLILIGGGYGVEGTVRNDFRELVSPSTSSFTWSLPNSASISCSIEIMNHSAGDATVWVWASNTCTFTEITALTTEAMNASLLTTASSIPWSKISSKPTTISGYGITDAKIANGAITLGSYTISSQAAASGGTNVSLVTTGEKYIWNSKTSNTGTVTSITPGNGLINGTSGTSQTAITTSGTISIKEGGVTNAMLAGSIANGKLSNSKVTIAGTDVSLGGSITADALRTSLGLSNAMHFRGIATVAIDEGTNKKANPTITGYDFGTNGANALAGDVVIDKDSAYEYVWSADGTNGQWERLGGDSSYKTTQTAVNDPTAATTTSTTFIDTISQNTNGVITATKKTLPTAGTNVAGIIKIGTTANDACAGNDSRLSNARTPTSHTHGNLTNDGKITSTATIANGDKLVIVDSDTTAASKITGSSITFDGSTATKALTQKGTWETFNNYSHPTGDGNLHVPATSTTNNGKFLQAGSTAGSISWASLPTASSSTAGITTVGASGGAAAYSHTHSYLANTNTGAADRPIYITGNAPAQTTYRMSGTNTTATTAIAITTDLPTGNWYVNGTSDIYSQNDGVVYAEQYSSSWIHEIYGDYRTGQIAVRGKNNGTWQAWRKVLDSSNWKTLIGATTAAASATKYLREDGSWQVPTDTKNTAGSTNSTSQLFLIGATTQNTNPTTNSYQYTYTNNGLLSSTKLGLNASGTEKVHMEWNATDLSLDFIFD